MTTKTIERDPLFSRQEMEADAAFDRAIDCGRLSADRNSPVYAGLYMYMGRRNGCDLFKHVDTRRYLP